MARLLLPLVLVLLLALLPASTTSAELTYRLSVPMVAYDPTTIEEELFNAHNRERVANSLAPMAWSPDLALIAQEDAVRNMQRGYLEHDGLYTQQVTLLYPNTVLLGENLGVGGPLLYNEYVYLASRFMVFWMNSSSHRDNILYPTYDVVGIGSAIDSAGGVWVAVIFVDVP